MSETPTSSRLQHPDAGGPTSSMALLQRLFPGLSPATGKQGRHLIALPDPDRARLLIPGGSRLAGGALRRMRRPTSRAEQAVTALVATALGMGAGRVLPAALVLHIDDTRWNIEDELSGVLGIGVRAGVFLGPPRANRKPVLQLYAATGELVAVVKVGVNALTSDLARAEARALRHLGRSPLPDVVVPRLIAEHEWQGMAMVVQSPLRTWGHAKTLTERDRHTVFSAVARSRGTHHTSLWSSGYLSSLRARTGRLPEGAVRSRALDALALKDAQDHLEFGSWHGDLTSWNMTRADGQLLVWDWERYATGVPVGFDALHHYFLPSTKRSDLPLERAGVDLLHRSASITAPLGVSRACAPTVAMLYLIDLAVRFTRDGQASTGIRGGEAERWLLPALDLYSTQCRGRS